MSSTCFFQTFKFLRCFQPWPRSDWFNRSQRWEEFSESLRNWRSSTWFTGSSTNQFRHHQLHHHHQHADSSHVCRTRNLLLGLLGAGLHGAKKAGGRWGNLATDGVATLHSEENLRDSGRLMGKGSLPSFEKWIWMDMDISFLVSDHDVWWCMYIVDCTHIMRAHLYTF